MSGHSKWKNIQHRKGRQDAKRGKVFTKLIREITVAARLGGEDPAANPRLRAVLDKAFAANMTRDTIQRAIKRGAGGEEGSNLEEIRYEGYGPAGVAIIVDCLTDNKNRTVAEVRHVFTKAGSNLGTAGSVAYLFNKTGLMTFAPGTDENKIMEVAIDSGANDIATQDDGSIEVITDPENFETVKEALNKAGLKTENAEVTWIASTEISINDLDTAEKLMKFLEALEDLDDVQNVYSNDKIPTEIMDKLDN